MVSEQSEAGRTGTDKPWKPVIVHGNDGSAWLGIWLPDDTRAQDKYYLMAIVTKEISKLGKRISEEDSLRAFMHAEYMEVSVRPNTYDSTGGVVVAFRTANPIRLDMDPA